MRNRIILLCVFVLVIPFADFAIVENSSKSNKGAVSDDVKQAGRILNDFHDIFNYVTSNVARLMFPVMLKITEEVNVTRSCIDGGMRLLEDLKQNRGWTLQLIDSFGKPFGIISGKLWLHGDFDQCLNIEVLDDETRKNDEKSNTMHGKFCALTIGFNSYEFSDVPVHNHKNTKNMLRLMKDIVKPFPLSKIFEMVKYSKVMFRVDICIPSTCSREDVENILQWALKDSYRAEVKFCKVKHDKIRLSTVQIICITAISIFIAWVFIGTFLETLIILNIVNVPCDKGKILQSFVSVSLIASNQKLFSTDFNNETRFICGIKFFLTCIVVFGHLFIYSAIVYTTAEKLLNFVNITDDVTIEIVSQGQYILQMFFFLSGFLTFYLRRNDEENSISYYFIFFIKRYIRLTLPLLLLLAFFIILPICGEGPHWDLVYEESRIAEQYWWRNILHVMNLVNVKSSFTLYTWFLSVLMQLTVITVPLLYIHDKWPTFGTILLCILIVAGIVSHVCYSLHKEHITILNLAIDLEKYNNFLVNFYTKPYFSHMSSYCSGLLVGNYLLKKKQLKFRKEIFILCWISMISLLGLLFLVSLHSYKTDLFPNESLIMAHQILSPIAWTALIAWICVTFISGYGGVVNKFFSLDFFVTMNRLCFWIYLLHPVVFLYVFGKIRSPYSVTEINLWMLFLFVMFFTTIGAVFCYMFFEIPVSYILREYVFKKSYKKKYV